MSFVGSNKKEIVKKYQTAANDTGSPEVQVALLTTRIVKLTSHFRLNPHDNHSSRGMMKLISRRKNLLGYLKAENIDRYHKLIESLGLRK